MSDRVVQASPWLWHGQGPIPGVSECELTLDVPAGGVRAWGTSRCGPRRSRACACREGSAQGEDVCWTRSHWLAKAEAHMAGHPGPGQAQDSPAREAQAWLVRVHGS